MSAPADFEFAGLEAAINYRVAIVGLFRDYLRGDLIELGAGIGQMSKLFGALADVKSFMAVEPEAKYCERLRTAIPTMKVHQGFLSELDDARNACDAIVSINVFEHIEDDLAELKKCRALLKERKGVLCLLVPAGPELYSQIDRDFMHFRRYTAKEMREKLEDAGFQVEFARYFNIAGYFAWLLNFRLLQSRRFDSPRVKLFDRYIFPPAYWFEKMFRSPLFGQSVVAVARA